MDIQRLNQIAAREVEPENTDTDSLKNLANQYPFFQAPIFAYLKSLYLHDVESFDEELARLSIKVNDRRALFYYILSEEFDIFFQQTGKKEIQGDKTDILLNAFFESRDEDNGNNELEYSISHSSLATTDYFTYLQIEKKEENPAPPEERQLKHQNIIDSFIDKAENDGGIRITPIENDSKDYSEQVENVSNSDGDELNEDMFFTETLAKIYIKQKKYEKAYKIIKHLSLNYPKKNIYFADQLNFLEKLIINTKYKDTK